MTICFGSAAGEAAADDEEAAGAVKGSGPPPAAARASPFGSDFAANGSAPFPDPWSRFAWCEDATLEDGEVGAADELLLFDPLSTCGSSYASSAASTTASTTTMIFWRRSFATIRAVVADVRRLVAAAEANYCAV